MNGLSVVFALLVNLIASLAFADSSLVPLDHIWAYQMPGARKIEELDNAPRDVPGKGLLGQILESQVHRDSDKFAFKDMARPGFAVAGTGRAALQAAHAIFAEDAKPRDTFLTNEEVTIVFFSEPLSRYRVEIQQVKLNENEIGIRYELHGDYNGGFTNLALIPLGKLPAGNYHVESLQLPRERTSTEAKFGLKPLDKEWSKKWLCQPFSFSVTSERK